MTAVTTTDSTQSSRGGHTVPAWLFPALALGLGAGVSLTLGFYARVHTPTGEATPALGFSDTLHLKVWATVLAASLAFVQLGLGLWLFGRLPVKRRSPDWAGPLHRIVGSAALIVSLPVAYHCLWSLGLRADADPRVWMHAVAGCAFYGLFVAKVIVARKVQSPGFVLPVVATALLSALLVVAITSSGWFLTSVECCRF